jgi:hypothetical protein
MGIRALKHFISCNKHTNVLVLNIAQRHDLIPNSCVTNEIKSFSKALVKLKKNVFHLVCDNCGY